VLDLDASYSFRSFVLTEVADKVCCGLHVLGESDNDVVIESSGIETRSRREGT
jgi:hypothetical protein